MHLSKRNFRFLSLLLIALIALAATAELRKGGEKLVVARATRERQIACRQGIDHGVVEHSVKGGLTDRDRAVRRVAGLVGDRPCGAGRRACCCGGAGIRAGSIPSSATARSTS